MSGRYDVKSWGEREGYDIMYKMFKEVEIEPSYFTSPNTILGVFNTIFRNVDWALTCNIERLQDCGLLEYKPRHFYNYTLLDEEILSNMRQLGRKSLWTELDTWENFLIFKRAGYYQGKGTGRRDMMHLNETIASIIGWQAKIVKEGGKIDTCMKAILASSGIVIVTGLWDSSNYMSLNREAALIDFVGLENLTNIYRGTKYGEFTNFSDIAVRNYGMSIMYCMFQNYIVNGAIPFTLEDLCHDKEEPVRTRSMDMDCNHNIVKCSKCNKCVN